MIATILKSSNGFPAVDYNERKVSKGCAELLEMVNFGYIQDQGSYTTQDLQGFLKAYSDRNRKVDKTQFHVAISCKGREYSREQLLEFAHKYLKEMGYANEGQPLLIYFHHDTNNNHLHIITSRINPQGKKIDDHNERKRSQKVLHKLLGEDIHKDTSAIIEAAMAYKFATLGQFKAILESSGYECYTENDDLMIKKDGDILERINIDEISKHFTQTGKKDNSKRRRQLKAILQKYRDLSSDKDELRAQMKDKFVIDLIFTGSKDSPYGYMIVDHKNKVVIKGSDVLPLRSLLQFRDRSERLKECNAFIDKLFDENSAITTGELNKALHQRLGAYVKQGIVVMGNQRYHLDDARISLLKANDKRAWIQAFRPATAQERTILCKLGHIKDENLITIIPDKVLSDGERQSIEKIRNLMATRNEEVIANLKRNNMMLFNMEGRHYVVDMNNHAIIDMEKNGIPTDALQENSKSEQVLIHQSYLAQSTEQQAILPGLGRDVKKMGNSLQVSGGASDTNREWEISQGGDWDHIDDERALKR